MKKVLVAMSGGVDSSVAALLLKEEGFSVAGMSMIMWRVGSRCCNLNDIEDAKKVCAFLGIPHIVIDVEKEFRRMVVDPFVDAYLEGRTPNPCALCNREIKFGVALSFAERMGFDFFATGHHAIVERNCTRDERESPAISLKEGIDSEKSQTYFLAMVRRSSLERCLFPVGRLEKEEVKRIALENKLPVAGKDESQEVCFIPDRRVWRFIEMERGIEARKGIIVDSSGEEVGVHHGYYRYTKGQRKGLGISHKKPLYVLRTSPSRNEVMVGEREDLYTTTFRVGKTNWIMEKQPEGNFRAEVRVRYRQKPVPCTVLKSDSETGLRVISQSPIFAVTEGQIAVFNIGRMVISAGVIEHSS